MAGYQMPNVSGMNSVEELKNAVGKMAKELNWLLNNLDWKNINELNIQLNGGASVKIDNSGITINNGEVDTFKADIDGQVTMTGATIQSQDEYPKIVIDPETNLLNIATTPSVSMQVTANNTYELPAILWQTPAMTGGISPIPGTLYMYTSDGDIQISANQDLFLSANGFIRTDFYAFSDANNGFGSLASVLIEYNNRLNVIEDILQINQ
jgi:hypothetical protein